MIPITRKENYLNEIVGWGETAPEKPLTPEEFFFAAILGEAVQAPEPLTRYQMYLAKIAGRNIEIPYPEVRLEYFLARAAGMEIETPTPITREEMLWADYALTVEKELSGIPPLTFNAVAGTLKNYRIYGDTVDGESVGDLVTSGEHAGEYKVPVTVEGKNLFSSRIEQGSFDGITGAPNNVSTRVRSHEDDYIFLTPGVYKISAMGVEHFVIKAYDLPDVSAFNYNLSMPNWAPLSSTITINTSAYYKFAFCKTNNPIITPSDVSNIMLNTGSTALPYEPYHTPVTTPVYLPEPIKMVGDEAEYIDYAEQKLHRVRKNLFDEKYEGIDENNPSRTIVYKSINVGAGRFTLSSNVPTMSDTYCNLFLLSGIVDSGATSSHDGVSVGVTRTVTSINGYITIGYRYYDNVNPKLYQTQLERGNTATDYEPYIENNEVDVTLPAISTLAGTNTLTVGTEVQPSNVYIKYKGAR